MPEMWVPGATGPSLEDFVGRILRQIETFAKRADSGRAHVEVELHGGAILALHSISPEPGYGLITLRPFPEDDDRPWPESGEDGPLPPEEIMSGRARGLLRARGGEAGCSEPTRPHDCRR